MTDPMRFLWLVLVLWLGGCVGAADDRPLVYREGGQLLRQGVTAFTRSDFLGAAGLFRKALDRYQGVDDAQGMLESRINLAEVNLALGRLPEAAVELDAARALLDRLEVGEHAQRLRLLRAALLSRGGDYTGAEGLLAPLLPEPAAARRGGSTPDAVALVALADRTRLAFAQDAADAETWTERLAAEPALPWPLAARLERFQAELLRRRQHHAEADALLASALARYRARAHRPGIAATLEEQAEASASRGDREAARDLWRRAFAIRVRILDRPGSLAVLEKLRSLYLEMGAPERVRAVEEWMAIIGDRRLEDWPAAGGKGP